MNTMHTVIYSGHNLKRYIYLSTQHIFVNTYESGQYQNNRNDKMTKPEFTPI